jgi:hypothetical protein
MISHPLLELRTGEQHEAGRRFEKDQRRPFPDAGARSDLGRQDESPSVSHDHLMRPTHAASVPLGAELWASPLTGLGQ